MAGAGNGIGQAMQSAQAGLAQSNQYAPMQGGQQPQGYQHLNSSGPSAPFMDTWSKLSQGGGFGQPMGGQPYMGGVQGTPPMSSRTPSSGGKGGLGGAPALPEGDMGMNSLGGDPRFGGPLNANQSTNTPYAQSNSQRTQMMGQGAGTPPKEQFRKYAQGNTAQMPPAAPPQGNAAQMPSAAPPQGANTQPPNIFNTAAQGMNQSIKAAGLETMYNPERVSAGTANASLAQSPQQVKADQVGYDPVSSTNVSAERIDPTNVASTNVSANNVNAGQIADTDLSQYTNKYESQVVQQSLNDLERSRLMQANDIGAQATRAGAFGGSRQAIMESEMNRNAMDQAAKLASGLRQTGFQNAQQLAGQDIASRMQADLANQGANLQAGQSNQSAGLQASLANQQAGLTAGSQNQNTALQAALANQSTGMQAGLANQSAGIQTGLANQGANLQANSLNANLGQQTNLSNQAALNQTSQFNIGNQLSADLANQQSGLAGSQNRQSAANTLGNLSNTGFNQGMTLSNQAWQQGGLMQGINQMLIDAAKGQYGGYTGAPAQSLGYMTGAIGSSPTPISQTNSQQPGLFDYLTLAATAGR